jgi:hypothetical protein
VSIGSIKFSIFSFFLYSGQNAILMASTCLNRDDVGRTKTLVVDFIFMGSPCHISKLFISPSSRSCHISKFNTSVDILFQRGLQPVVWTKVAWEYIRTSVYCVQSINHPFSVYCSTGVLGAGSTRTCARCDVDANYEGTAEFWL